MTSKPAHEDKHQSPASIKIVAPADFDGLQELQNIFSKHYDLVPDQRKGIVLETATIIAILKVAGAAAGAAAAAIKLADAIVDWRNKRRQQGQDVSGHLQAPAKSALDLASASDSAVRSWFQAAP